MAKPNGRPPIEINWDDFEKLCGLQCTQQEIADWFKCSPDTIDRHCKQHYESSFAEVFRQKRGGGRISLRRKQMEIALKGNVTMLIFLGKQYLGQSDKIEPEQEQTKDNRDHVIAKLASMIVDKDDSK